MHGKDLAQLGDLKYLADQAGRPANPQLSAFFGQLLGHRDDGTKAIAADIRQISNIDHEDRKPFGDAGLASWFKASGTLHIHTAGQP